MPQLAAFLQTTTGKLVAAGVGLLGLILLCFAGGLAVVVVNGLNSTPIPAVVQPLSPSLTPQPTQLSALPTATLPPPSATPTSTETPLPTPTATQVVPPTGTLTPTPGPTPAQPLPAPTAPAGSPPQPTRGPLQEAYVIYVVDGDTIDVVINQQEYRVHYLLVDAPEMDAGSEAQPFGLAAAELNRALVDRQTVLLEKDVSDTDSNGNLLRYVYVGGLMVNEDLLRQGLAQVAGYPPDVKYEARFLAVQEEARTARRGLWSLEPVTEQP